MTKIIAYIIISIELLTVVYCMEDRYTCNIVNLTEFSKCVRICKENSTTCPKLTCPTPAPALVIEVTTDVSKQALPYSSSVLRSTFWDRAKICGDYECRAKPKNLTENKNDTIQGGFFLPRCGNIFVSDSINLVTGNELAKTCCDLNLIPAIITAHEYIQCLKFGVMEMQEKLASPSKNNQHNTLNRLFLVAARDVMLNHNFLTCPKANRLFFPRFLPGEPDNRFGIETCLAVNLREDIQGLDDVSCNVAMRFLCKKIERSPKRKIPPYNILGRLTSLKNIMSQCKSQKCSDSPQVSYLADGTVKVNNLLQGNLLFPCGNKQYLIGKKQLSVDAAKSFIKCCQLGGVLAKITDRSQMICIKIQLMPLTPANAKFHDFGLWVQGEDVYYNQTFVTCPNMDSIKDGLWGEDRPNNADFKERCVIFMYSNEVNGLDDIFCENKYPYICEVSFKVFVKNPKDYAMPLPIVIHCHIWSVHDES